MWASYVFTKDLLSLAKTREMNHIMLSCDGPAIAFKWQYISAEFTNYCKGKVCKLNINQ